MSRDADTPDTIVSSSSPECVIPECVHKFPGLRLIDEESDEETDWLKRVSPVIPIVSPIPIRLKPGYLKDSAKQDKENLCSSRYVLKRRSLIHSHYFKKIMLTGVKKYRIQCSRIFLSPDIRMSTAKICLAAFHTTTEPLE